MNLNAVTLHNQNFAAKLDEPYLNENKNIENFKIPNNELKYDEFINSSKNNSQEKVSFKEGLKLVGKGFINKLKNMATSIIQHPVKTLAAVGATALLISAAPLIGVASATAGAFLALGFAVYAVGKTAVDVVETVKDNKEGRYDEVRQDLEKIGGDGVDLALSLPFAPKAINQVSRFARYGTGTVGLNTELLSNLKNCRSYSDVSLEFAKADTLINYEMIGNEMGLTIKPELEFVSNEYQTPSYDYATGKVKMPEQFITNKGKISLRTKGKSLEGELRHELEHFEQWTDMARTMGAENLKQYQINNAKTMYKEAGGILEAPDEVAYKEELAKHKLPKKINSNEELDKYVCDVKEIYKIKERRFNEMYDFEANKRTTLDKFGPDKDLVNDLVFDNGSKFNEKFYQSIIDKNGMYQSSSPQAAKAQEYILQEAERATKIYDMDFQTNNVLESEARKAEQAFNTSAIKGRPAIVNDAVMADATIEEYFSEDDAKLIDPNRSLYSNLKKKSE